MNKNKIAIPAVIIFLVSGCGTAVLREPITSPAIILRSTPTFTPAIQPTITRTPTQMLTPTLDYKEPCFILPPEQLNETTGWKTFISLDGWKLKYPPTWGVGSCRMCDPVAKGAIVEFHNTDSTLFNEGSFEMRGFSTNGLGKTDQQIISDYQSETNLYFCQLNNYLSYRTDPKTNYGYKEVYFRVFGKKGIYLFSFGSIEKKVTNIEELTNYPYFQQMLMTFEEGSLSLADLQALTPSPVPPYTSRFIENKGDIQFSYYPPNGWVEDQSIGNKLASWKYYAHPIRFAIGLRFKTEATTVSAQEMSGREIQGVSTINNILSKEIIYTYEGLAVHKVEEEMYAVDGNVIIIYYYITNENFLFTATVEYMEGFDLEKQVPIVERSIKTIQFEE